MDDSRPVYAPGWYRDTTAPGFERWYDGTAWTQYTRPAGIDAATRTHADETADTPNTAGEAAAAPRRWYARKAIVIPMAVVAGVVVISSLSIALGSSHRSDIAPVASKPLASGVGAETPTTAPEPLATVPNVVGMSGTEATSALSGAGFTVDLDGGDPAMPVIAQDMAGGSQAAAGSTVRLTLEEKPSLSIGQQNALRSATQYLGFMHFSRAGLLKQLTSEYGEGYPVEDAEFAIASLEQAGKVDWNAEAAEAAQSYLDMMAFSREGLYDQLTSEYGEGFTPEQANAGLAAVGY